MFTKDYDNDTRKVLEISKLFDVSVVDTPFYEDTEIYARALGELEDHRGLLENSDAEELELEKLKSETLLKG